MSVVFILIFVLAVALVAVGIGLSRRDQRRQTAPVEHAPAAPIAREESPTPETEPEAEAGILGEVEPDEAVDLAEAPRLRDRLGKTRAAFSRLRSRTLVDEETLEELEDTLLLADVGIPTTTRVLDGVTQRSRDERITDGDGVMRVLHEELVAVLAANADRSLTLTPGEPNVWMFVGVNGVGKTTTIAKVAQRAIDDGHRVVLAAADTFRAAAAEQLAHWADRTGAGIVRGQDGADPGSVVFDAMSAAASRDADLVLVDTAGRLHTKVNLMAELEKLRRIVDRTPGAPHETLLTIDATTGQNGLTQARQFAEAVDVTGVVLTKLDGTAKGGIVLAIEAELGIPVKLVGVGEAASDLLVFDPEAFVAALLDA